jgi:hypothetical protein
VVSKAGCLIIKATFNNTWSDCDVPGFEMFNLLGQNICGYKLTVTSFGREMLEYAPLVYGMKIL